MNNKTDIVLKDGILVIATGGTIDSIERTWSRAESPKDVTMLKESLVGQFIERIKNGQLKFLKNIKPEDIEFRQNKKFCDSRYFNDADIANLASDIQKADVKNVIITCGTDYMIQLSQKLEKILKNDQMIVQTTGAITPLANGTKRNDEWEITDGYDNLEFALKNIDDKKLKPGIYVVLHRKIFNPDNVKKDFKNGRFLTNEEYYEIYPNEAKA